MSAGPALLAQSMRVSDTSAGACAKTGAAARQATAPAMEQWIDLVMLLSFRMAPLWKGASMSVSEGYRTYVIEQLATLPAVSTRRMFGGLGLYSGEWFFALIDDDVLYFKVDDVNRDDYTSRGMKAFMPFPGQPSLGYFQVPEDVIEEAEDLTRWARRSVEVAQRAGLKKKKTVRLKPDPQKKDKTAKKRKTPARKK